MHKQLSRVVWSEGMHLAQHHFQSQSRYFEDSLAFAVTQLFGDGFGLAAASFDIDALRGGTATLLQARGVMPDGLAFQMPDGDPLPAPLNLAAYFSPVRDQHLIRLTIPAHTAAGANTSAPNAASRTRFIAEPKAIRDEITGSDEQMIAFGRKNFRLTLDTDDSPDVHLPIARVHRDGSGHFVLDDDYIPPILQIGASSALMSSLHRLTEVLEAKANSMATERPGGAPMRDYAAHEIATFWLRHAILSSLAPLRHHLQTRLVSPETVYLEMSRLAGALCAFALDTHPNTLPEYHLDTLTDTFAALDRHIRAQLDVIVPNNAVAIPLRQTAPSLYTSAISDPRCFGAAKWILGIRSRAGEAETITRTPQLVKVCSAKFINELVRRAYPGLRLQHLVTPPAAISPRVDTQYFSIDRSGPCWDTLLTTHEIGVYVPDGLPEPELSLHVMVD